MKTKEKFTLIKAKGKGVYEIRIWKDEKGQLYRDPHPKIEDVPSEYLIKIN
jgi:hypothetical protein